MPADKSNKDNKERFVSVELVLRIVVVVSALPALIAAAVAVGTLNDLTGTSSPTEDLHTNTRGVTGWVIFIAIAAMAVMALFIFLLLAKSQEETTTDNVLAVDMLCSILLAMGYLAGGVAAAVFAKDWTNTDLPSSTQTNRIRGGLGAAAAFSFVSFVLDVVLFVLVLCVACGCRKKNTPPSNTTHDQPNKSA